MAHCPYCDAAMEPVYHESQPLEACPRCGGLWIAAGVMNDLARNHAATLAPLDDQWRDRGGRPPLDRPMPVDPASGEPLETRRFPFAPSIELLVSPRSGHLFFAEGRLRALHAVLSPETLPPDTFVAVDRAAHLAADPPEAEDDDEYRPPGLLEALRETRWPEPLEGQPRFAWFVSFMPLRWAALMLLIPGTFLCVTTGLHRDAGWSQAWLGLPTIYLAWAVEGLVQTAGIAAAMFLLNVKTGMPFGAQIVFMLRAVAVTFTICSLSYLILGAVGFGLLQVAVLNNIVRFAVLIYGLELDWTEAVWLTVLAGGIGAGLGL